MLSDPHSWGPAGKIWCKANRSHQIVVFLVLLCFRIISVPVALFSSCIPGFCLLPRFSFRFAMLWEEQPHPARGSRVLSMALQGERWG